jgi:pimeloyl-ACP methyl ester carboxylesterase
MEIIRSLWKKLIGKLVLPAQAIPLGPASWFKWMAANTMYSASEQRSLQMVWTHFHHENALNSELRNGKVIRHVYRYRYHVQQWDIDSIELAPYAKRAQPQADDIAILYIWGRSDCYEKKLKRMASDALNLNAMCVSFNFPGVAHSTGELMCFEDMAKVVVAQVKRLKEKGFADSKIKLYGHSLGGAAQILAAKMLQDEGIMISGFIDRSFGDLKGSAKALYQERPHVRRRYVKNILGLPALLLTGMLLGAVGFTVSTLFAAAVSSVLFFTPLLDSIIFKPINKLQDFLMRWTGWDIDAAKIYEKLHHHDHINVAKPRKNDSKPILGKRYVHPEKHSDRVIQETESLHRSLTLHQQQKKEIKQQLRVAQRARNRGEVSRLKDLLLSFNHKCSGGGHGDPLDKLVMRYPQQGRWITAQEKWYHFARPHGQHTDRRSKNYLQF